VDDHGEDSDLVKVRVRGQFPSQSAMQFISETDADKARNVHLRKEQYSFAPVILGVDPAWTGDDKLVIYCGKGCTRNASRRSRAMTTMSRWRTSSRAWRMNTRPTRCLSTPAMARAL
jgi:hypothetical protein